MAWDKTQPTNTTKIRNLGVVITPNWDAIETADNTFQPQALNLTDRDAAGLASNPTAISTAYIPFCKKDASGKPELFGIDFSSKVIQFSEAGLIGGATQDFKMRNFRFDTSTLNYNRNNIVSAWIKWTYSGGIVINSSFRMTATRISEGVYRFSLTDTRANPNYIITGNADIGGNSRCFKFGSQTTSQFTLNIQNGSGSFRDSGGYIQVVGGF